MTTTQTELNPRNFDDVMWFKGLHDCTSKCRVQIWHERCTVVMLTELPDNPGTSITNFAEGLAEIAMRVLREFIPVINGDDVVWKSSAARP